MNRKIFLIIAILILFPVLGQGETSHIDINISAIVEGEPITPTPPSGPGGGGSVTPSPPANVVFEGRAYPDALLTLTKNGKVAATFFADNSGKFRKELTGVAGGTYNFGIWAEDTDGRKSVTLGFTIGVLPERTTTVSGIFISPTIALTPTQVEKGNMVAIFGQSFPESQIKIFVASKEIVKQTNSTKEGKWIYKLDTDALEESEHQARASALYKDGEQSPFSQSLSFLVLPRGALVCKGADLNFDGKVNIIDFSILLYFWGQKSPSNYCADINFDGKVNIVDFSIMMYQWSRS